MRRRLAALAALGCALFFGNAEASPVDPGLSAAGPAPEIDILTWNVFLRPQSVLADKQSERALHMPAHLSSAEVVVLNEAFDDSARRVLLDGLKPRLPFHSRILGKDTALRQDGGVMVLSRWPIEQEDSVIFDDCSGTDCFADKGVNYVAIKKGDRRYHIFATHLQAQDTTVRKKQLRAFSRFVSQKNIPIDEPVLFVGDFNVDRNSTEYFEMLDTLRARCPEPIGHPYTSDPQNQLVPKTRSPSFIDYVLYSRDHLWPRKSFLEPQIFRGPQKGAPDLSDHYAVLGRLLF
jgi:endonuclease/exonuclease/phosphatase family metal-dependent hydrolase